MRGVAPARLLPLIALLAASPALAWAPQTRIRMVDEAVGLMPAGLRLALERHRETLLRGVLAPMAEEDSPGHRPPWQAGGRLDERLAREAEAVVAALDGGASFSAIVEALGRAAHYVLDAGFPPGVGSEGSAERYAHFSRFCETRRERFPLVFYGHDDPLLAAADFRGFALAVMRGASDDDRQLARAYAAAGNPPDPTYFDDRSVPFAVGSLSYSRSVTNVVRLWLAVWSQAGGDMGRTPYRKAGTAPAGERSP